jgi:hypothetical protein
MLQVKIWIITNPDSLRGSLLSIVCKYVILLHLKRCEGDSEWTTLLNIFVSSFMCVNMIQVYGIRTDMEWLTHSASTRD